MTVSAARSLRLPISDFLLALAVVAVWGTNFVVAKIALADLPPLFFATLRFLFAFLPAAFFLRRPPVSRISLSSYGILIGVGQFGLLYIAMARSISPGLASLVIQMQVFFTIGISTWLSKERFFRFQAVALLLATAGLVIVGIHSGESATPVGLTLVLAAAACWGIANSLAKNSGSHSTLAYVVWASMYAIAPLLALSLICEGPTRIVNSVIHANWMIWAAVLYQSVANTLFGYGVWAWLLVRYPAATVMPIALLVPLVGMSSSAWLLHEPIQSWKMAAMLLIMAGLTLNILWPRLRSRERPPFLKV